MQKLVPNLWYDTQALEAAQFYTSLFDDSRINWTTIVEDTPSGDSEQLSFTLAGLEFFAISAGPYFTFNPAISLTVRCSQKEEVDRLFEHLSEGGQVMMELGSYPFSDRYVWLSDCFGLSWQLLYTEEKFDQKIVPSLMFVGDQHGRAEAALKTYTALFPDSHIHKMDYYDEGMGEEFEGALALSSVELAGVELTAMDGGKSMHDFQFNEAISFMVYCEDQQELDYYWNSLSAVPEAEECGWLKDQYGVSWQIVPRELDQLFLSDDQEAVKRMLAALLKMKKISIEEVRMAFDGEGLVE